MISAKLDPENDRLNLSGPAKELQALRANLSRHFGSLFQFRIVAGGFTCDANWFADALEELNLKVSGDHSFETWLSQRTSALKSHLLAVANIQSILESEDSPSDQTGISFLKAYQRTAVSAMTQGGLRGLCLFDEQGVGKTLTSLAAFKALKSSGEISQVLIVAPKSLLGSWEQEARSFFPDDGFTYMRIEGSRAERYALALQKADIYTMTFDALRNDLITIQNMAKRGKTLLIIDESFYVKNESAARSKALWALRQMCSRCFVLCGTPAPNSADDIVNQVNLADLGYSFRNFRSTGDDDSDWKSINEIIAGSAPIIRRVKEDVLPNLPAKNFEVVKVPLKTKQRILYDQTAETMRIFLRGINEETFQREIPNYLAMRSTLSQICIDTRLVGDLDAISCKYEKLEQLCREMLDADKSQKLVIWSHYRASTEVLEKMLGKYGLVRVDGSINSATERQRRVNEFQNNPELRIFLGNAAAAGAGLTLTAANTAIYVSWSLQAAHYMQSLDRIHRIGQLAGEVKYLFLVAQDTIEESDMKLISSKQMRQSTLLADPESDALTLSDAIKELGAVD